MQPRSPDEPLPRRSVRFHDPKAEKESIQEAICLIGPSVDDLEMWLEFQAGQLGTPAWWEELGTMLGTEDQRKFAWKIRASFYVLAVWLRASLEQGYTVPPATQEFE